jgi:hypothetical protein
MTSCADQCRFAAAHRTNAPARARTYGICAQILPDCHKLKYCHLVANSSARKLLPRVCHCQDGLRLASQTTGEGKCKELARQGKGYKRRRQGKSEELARRGKGGEPCRTSKGEELARASRHHKPRRTSRHHLRPVRVGIT